MKGNDLTVSAPYVEGDGEFEERIKLSTVTYLSSPMEPITFSSLKAVAKIMTYSQPPACVSAFYQLIRIEC